MGLGSGIRKKPIPDPGSRGQKGTGSRIRLRNTGKKFSLLPTCQIILQAKMLKCLQPSRGQCCGSGMIYSGAGSYFSGRSGSGSCQVN
jgi:hypothetical protein